MSYIELFLIAIGLSMDAFAVSISNGLCCTKLKKSQVLAIGVCFGGFQGLMPTIGYFLGKAFESYITAIDHYIALILLGYIGGKMVYDALTQKEEEKHTSLPPSLLLTQGIATSIDALAVGVSFAALPNVNIIAAALFIAGVTFVCSVIGVCFGKFFGEKLGSRAMLAGGLILIAIGVKIFVEHMFFS